MTGWSFFLEKRLRLTMGQGPQRFIAAENTDGPGCLS